MGGRLQVVSVAGRHAEGFAAPSSGVRRRRRTSPNRAPSYQAALDAALAELPDEVDATGEVLTGEVVDSLAALDDRDVDVLVCGSRGYGPLRRVLLGGVSARLIRHASAPVVVPRSGD